MNAARDNLKQSKHPLIKLFNQKDIMSYRDIIPKIHLSYIQKSKAGDLLDDYNISSFPQLRLYIEGDETMHRVGRTNIISRSEILKLVGTLIRRKNQERHKIPAKRVNEKREIMTMLNQ